MQLGQTSQKSNLIYITSEQISKPNLMSISHETKERKVRKTNFGKGQ